MEKRIIIALHGFLGLPEDWTSWHQKYAPNAELRALNLWSDSKLSSKVGLTDWTQAFLKWAQSLKNQNGFLKNSFEIWGYSMGGRLALGALLQAPELFERAVILSANPGIKNEDERISRWQRDLQWSEKFQKQEWSSLMKEWNQHPVLREEGSVDNSVYRREENYSRDSLAQALLNWSVAKQPNYWPRLKELSLPIEWHVGELDHTYKNMVKEIEQINSKIQLHIHAKRGHRLIGQ